MDEPGVPRNGGRTHTGVWAVVVNLGARLRAAGLGQELKKKKSSLGEAQAAYSGSISRGHSNRPSSCHTRL